MKKKGTIKYIQSEDAFQLSTFNSEYLITGVTPFMLNTICDKIKEEEYSATRGMDIYLSFINAEVDNSRIVSYDRVCLEVFRDKEYFKTVNIAITYDTTVKGTITECEYIGPDKVVLEVEGSTGKSFISVNGVTVIPYDVLTEAPKLEVGQEVSFAPCMVEVEYPISTTFRFIVNVKVEQSSELRSIRDEILGDN